VPDAEWTKTYASLYEQYRALYPALVPTFRALA